MKRGKWKATKFTLINFPAIYFHLAREINRDLPYVSFIFPFFPICSHDFLMIFLDVPIFSYGFPMIFLYVPIFSHGFPWFSPGFPMMGSLTAQDLPKGGQCGRRPAGHTIREADFNPSLWWYHGNGNNKLAGRKPSYLARENRAGKCQINQPRWNNLVISIDCKRGFTIVIQWELHRESLWIYNSWISAIQEWLQYTSWNGRWNDWIYNSDFNYRIVTFQLYNGNISRGMWWWWWLLFFFQNIWDVILPIDELISFKTVIAPPTSNDIYIYDIWWYTHIILRRKQHKFKPIGSMVLLSMVTWIPSIYPSHVSIYIPAPWILWEWEYFQENVTIVSLEHPP